MNAIMIALGALGTGFGLINTINAYSDGEPELGSAHLTATLWAVSYMILAIGM